MTFKEINKSLQWIGIIQVILAGVGFGFLGIFGRLAFKNDLSIGELLFWRFIFASLFLWIFAINFQPKLIKIKFSQLGVSILLGIFGYAVFSTLYFESIKGVSVALAAMLLFTFPIFVSLGSHFILKEKMNLLQWLTLFIACLGLAVLLWGDIIINSYQSVLYGISAAITYSIYVLVSGRFQKNIQPLTSSLYIISAAALGLYLFHQPNLNRIFLFNANQFLIIFGIAIICSIGPMTLFLAGLQKMKSSQASLLVMIEPVIAALAAWLILEEQLSLRQLAGGALVILALALNTLSHK